MFREWLRGIWFVCDFKIENVVVVIIVYKYNGCFSLVFLLLYILSWMCWIRMYVYRIENEILDCWFVCWFCNGKVIVCSLLKGFLDL